MKYMLLIMGNEATMNTAPTVADTGMSAEFGAYHEALVKSGAYIGGERLKPTREAKSVRVRDRKAVILDGPYAETQEQLGGYYIIDVPDMETAVEWAKKCPSARGGTVEVRPIWPTRGNWMAQTAPGGVEIAGGLASLWRRGTVLRRCQRRNPCAT